MCTQFSKFLPALQKCHKDLGTMRSTPGCEDTRDFDGKCGTFRLPAELLNFLKNGGQKGNVSHDPLAAERRTPGEWEERNN